MKIMVIIKSLGIRTFVQNINQDTQHEPVLFPFFRYKKYSIHYALKCHTFIKHFMLTCNRYRHISNGVLKGFSILSAHITGGYLCLSILILHLPSHVMDFDESWYGRYTLKVVQGISFWSLSVCYNSYLT
jgi:hypothetical protein